MPVRLLFQPSRPGSNECLLNGERLVIKTANPGNTKVGVSYQMLETLDGVVGAFSDAPGEFDLYRLSPAVYRENMTPTRSKGRSTSRVGMVPKSVFQSKGRPIGSAKLAGGSPLPLPNNGTPGP